MTVDLNLGTATFKMRLNTATFDADIERLEKSATKKTFTVPFKLGLTIKDLTADLVKKIDGTGPGVRRAGKALGASVGTSFVAGAKASTKELREMLIGQLGAAEAGVKREGKRLGQEIGDAINAGIQSRIDLAKAVSGVPAVETDAKTGKKKKTTKSIAQTVADQNKSANAELIDEIKKFNDKRITEEKKANTEIKSLRKDFIKEIKKLNTGIISAQKTAAKEVATARVKAVESTTKAELSAKKEKAKAIAKESADQTAEEIRLRTSHAKEIGKAYKEEEKIVVDASKDAISLRKSIGTELSKVQKEINSARLKAQKNVLGQEKALAKQQDADDKFIRQSQLKAMQRSFSEEQSLIKEGVRDEVAIRKAGLGEIKKLQREIDSARIKARKDVLAEEKAVAKQNDADDKFIRTNYLKELQRSFDDEEKIIKQGTKEQADLYKAGISDIQKIQKEVNTARLKARKDVLAQEKAIAKQNDNDDKFIRQSQLKSFQRAFSEEQKIIEQGTKEEIAIRKAGFTEIKKLQKEVDTARLKARKDVLSEEKSIAKQQDADDKFIRQSQLKSFQRAFTEEQRIIEQGAKEEIAISRATSSELQKIQREVDKARLQARKDVLAAEKAIAKQDAADDKFIRQSQLKAIQRSFDEEQKIIEQGTREELALRKSGLAEIRKFQKEVDTARVKARKNVLAQEKDIAKQQDADDKFIRQSQLKAFQRSFSEEQKIIEQGTREEINLRKSGLSEIRKIQKEVDTARLKARKDVFAQEKAIAKQNDADDKFIRQSQLKAIQRSFTEEQKLIEQGTKDEVAIRKSTSAELQKLQREVDSARLKARKDVLADEKAIAKQNDADDKFIRQSQLKAIQRSFTEEQKIIEQGTKDEVAIRKAGLSEVRKIQKEVDTARLKARKDVLAEERAIAKQNDADDKFIRQSQLKAIQRSFNEEEQIIKEGVKDQTALYKAGLSDIQKIQREVDSARLKARKDVLAEEKAIAKQNDADDKFIRQSQLKSFQRAFAEEQKIIEQGTKEEIAIRKATSSELQKIQREVDSARLRARKDVLAEEKAITKQQDADDKFIRQSQLKAFQRSFTEEQKIIEQGTKDEVAIRKATSVELQKIQREVDTARLKARKDVLAEEKAIAKQQDADDKFIRTNYLKELQRSFDEEQKIIERGAKEEIAIRNATSVELQKLQRDVDLAKLKARKDVLAQEKAIAKQDDADDKFIRTNYLKELQRSFDEEQKLIEKGAKEEISIRNSTYAELQKLQREIDTAKLKARKDVLTEEKAIAKQQDADDKFIRTNYLKEVQRSFDEEQKIIEKGSKEEIAIRKATSVELQKIQREVDTARLKARKDVFDKEKAIAKQQDADDKFIRTNYLKEIQRSFDEEQKIIEKGSKEQLKFQREIQDEMDKLAEEGRKAALATRKKILKERISELEQQQKDELDRQKNLRKSYTKETKRQYDEEEKIIKEGTKEQVSLRKEVQAEMDKLAEEGRKAAVATRKKLIKERIAEIEQARKDELAADKAFLAEKKRDQMEFDREYAKDLRALDKEVEKSRAAGRKKALDDAREIAKQQDKLEEELRKAREKRREENHKKFVKRLKTYGKQLGEAINKSFDNAIKLSKLLTDAVLTAAKVSLSAAKNAGGVIAGGILGALRIGLRAVQSIVRNSLSGVNGVVKSVFSTVGNTIKKALYGATIGIGIGIGQRIGQDIINGIVGALPALNRAIIDGTRDAANLVGSAVQDSAEVDKAIRTAIAIGGKDTDNDGAIDGEARLRQEITVVAQDPNLQITTSELAEVVLQQAKAGRTLEQIADGLLPVARLVTINAGTGTVATAERISADFLTSTAKYNLAAEENADGFSEQTRALAALQGASTAAKVELNDLAQSLRYYSRSENDFGGFSEATTLTALAARSGQIGSAAGVGLNEIFSARRLSNLGSVLNVEVTDANGDIRDRVALMRELIDAYQQAITVGNKLEIDKEINKITGERGGRTFNAIAGLDDDAFNEVLRSVEKGQQTLDNIFESYEDRIGKGFVAYENALEAASVQLGNNVSGAVDGALLGVSAIINNVVTEDLFGPLAKEGLKLRDIISKSITPQGNLIENSILKQIADVIRELLRDGLKQVANLLREITDILADPKRTAQFVENLKAAADVVRFIGKVVKDIVVTEFRVAYNLLTRFSKIGGSNENRYKAVVAAYQNFTTSLVKVLKNIAKFIESLYTGFQSLFSTASNLVSNFAVSSNLSFSSVQSSLLNIGNGFADQLGVAYANVKRLTGSLGLFLEGLKFRETIANITGQVKLGLNSDDVDQWQRFGLTVGAVAASLLILGPNPFSIFLGATAILSQIPTSALDFLSENAKKWGESLRQFGTDAREGFFSFTDSLKTTFDIFKITGIELLNLFKTFYAGVKEGLDRSGVSGIISSLLPDIDFDLPNVVEINSKLETLTGGVVEFLTTISDGIINFLNSDEFGLFIFNAVAKFGDVSRSIEKNLNLAKEFYANLIPPEAIDTAKDRAGKYSEQFVAGSQDFAQDAKEDFVPDLKSLENNFNTKGVLSAMMRFLVNPDGLKVLGRVAIQLKDIAVELAKPFVAVVEPLIRIVDIIGRLLLGALALTLPFVRHIAESINLLLLPGIEIINQALVGIQFGLDLIGPATASLLVGMDNIFEKTGDIYETFTDSLVRIVRGFYNYVGEAATLFYTEVRAIFDVEFTQFKNNMGEVRDNVIQTFTNIRDWFVQAADNIRNNWTEMNVAIRADIASVEAFFVLQYKNLLATGASVLESIKFYWNVTTTFINERVLEARMWFGKQMEAIGNYFSKIRVYLENQWKAFVEGFKAQLEYAKELFIYNFERVKLYFLQLVRDLVRKFREFIDSIRNYLRGFLGILDTIRRAVVLIFTSPFKALEKLYTLAKRLIQPFEAIRNVFTGITSQVQAAAQAITDLNAKAASIGSGVKQRVTSGVTGTLDRVRNFFKPVSSGAESSSIPNYTQSNKAIGLSDTQKAVAQGVEQGMGLIFKPIAGRSKSQLEGLLDNDKVQRFIEVIRYGEGTQGDKGFNTIFGGRQFSSFRDHPRLLQSAGGYTSDASGVGQFLSTTWDDLAERYGLNDFSPKNQLIGVLGLLDESGALDSLLDNKLQQAIIDAAPTWASLPTYSGNSYYGQPVKSFNELFNVYNNGGKGSYSGVAGSSVSKKVATTNVGLLSAQEYGVSRSGGTRRHAGTDIDYNPNDVVYALLDGVVTRVGYDPGGYGNYIDVYNKERGVVNRLAEMDTLNVGLGDTVRAGDIIGKGTLTTGVVHTEIRKDVNSQGQGGFGFQGTVDPIKYLEQAGTVKRNGTKLDIFSGRGGSVSSSVNLPDIDFNTDELEAAVEENNKAFAELLKAISSGVPEYDPDGVISANDVREGILGDGSVSGGNVIDEPNAPTLQDVGGLAGLISHDHDHDAGNAEANARNLQISAEAQKKISDELGPKTAEMAAYLKRVAKDGLTADEVKDIQALGGKVSLTDENQLKATLTNPAVLDALGGADKFAAFEKQFPTLADQLSKDLQTSIEVSLPEGVKALQQAFTSRGKNVSTQTLIAINDAAEAEAKKLDSLPSSFSESMIGALQSQGFLATGAVTFGNEYSTGSSSAGNGLESSLESLQRLGLFTGPTEADQLERLAGSTESAMNAIERENTRRVQQASKPISVNLQGLGRDKSYSANDVQQAVTSVINSPDTEQAFMERLIERLAHDPALRALIGLS